MLHIIELVPGLLGSVSLAKTRPVLLPEARAGKVRGPSVAMRLEVLTLEPRPGWLRPPCLLPGQLPRNWQQTVL